MPSSKSRFRRTFSESLHDPTPLHRFGVTPASQELVQTPIHPSNPASDAGLGNFDSKAQRICPALNAFQSAPIAHLNNYLHRPRRTRSFTLEGVPLRRTTNCSRAGKVWLSGTGAAQNRIAICLWVASPDWTIDCIDYGNGTEGLTGIEWNLSLKHYCLAQTKEDPRGLFKRGPMASQAEASLCSFAAS
jgi:hypothetical protein